MLYNKLKSVKAVKIIIIIDNYYLSGVITYNIKLKLIQNMIKRERHKRKGLEPLTLTFCDGADCDLRKHQFY